MSTELFTFHVKSTTFKGYLEISFQYFDSISNILLHFKKVTIIPPYWKGPLYPPRAD